MRSRGNNNVGSYTIFNPSHIVVEWDLLFKSLGVEGVKLGSVELAFSGLRRGVVLLLVDHKVRDQDHLEIDLLHEFSVAMNHV